MGKCTRKAKTSDEVSSQSQSQSFITGVRTRAKTLALKQNVDFLELRSRRLEKIPFFKKKLNQKKEVSEQVSVGENHLDDKERSTRESTPVSLIRTADSITAPGSSTKPAPGLSTKPRSPNTPSPRSTNIPTSEEIEEFFAHVEQSQQQLFMEKYNFDVVNEAPLPGRYEWVKVNP